MVYVVMAAVEYPTGARTVQRPQWDLNHVTADKAEADVECGHRNEIEKSVGNDRVLWFVHEWEK